MSLPLELRVVDQSESEPRLHRIYYLIKYLRASLLNVLLLFVAFAFYRWFGVENLYPGFGKWLSTLQLMNVDMENQGVSTRAFYPLFFVLVFALFWWIYASLVRVRRVALRIQALYLLLSVLFSPLILFRSFRFAVHELHPALLVFQLAYVLFSMVFISDAAIQMWLVARLTDKSAFVATLDRRLASSPWSYFNKLLDLPRSPFASWRSVVSYIGAFTAASLFIVCSVTIMKFGEASTEMERLYELCHESATIACYDDSKASAIRSAIEILAGIIGLRLAVFLQAAVRRFGALSIPAVLNDQRQRFVLYLRPFDTDDVVLPEPELPFLTRLVTSRPFPVRVEEELFDVADGYLPLVAIARPRDTVDYRRSDLAHRFFLEDAEWKPYVQELIERASFIVMVVRFTDGVAWELDKILGREVLKKTLFFFDPLCREREHWYAVEQKIVPIFQAAGALPADFRFEGEPVAFTIGPDAVTEYRNDHWTATSYRTVFSTFLAENVPGAPRILREGAGLAPVVPAGEKGPPGRVDVASAPNRAVAPRKWVPWAALLAFSVLVATCGLMVRPRFDSLVHPFGQRIVFQRGELYYLDPATKKEATSVGNYLVEDGFFSDVRVSVQLDRRDGVYRLRFVANRARIDEFAIFFAKMGSDVSRVALEGAPLEVALCDDRFHPLKILPQTMRLTFGKGEIYYPNSIGITDAQNVGDSLVEQGYFTTERTRSVYLDRQESTYRLYFVVEPANLNDSVVLGFAKAGSDVARSALAGAPLEVTLCNDSLKPVRVLPQTTRLLFAKGELYYSAPVPEPTARQVGALLQDHNYFNDKQPVSVLLGREDDAFQLRYVVIPSRASDPTLIAAFTRQTDSLVPKAFGGEPIVMILCGPDLRSLVRRRFDPDAGTGWSDLAP